MRHSWSEEEIARVRAMKADKRTWQEIATTLGVTRRSAINAIVRANRPAREREDHKRSVAVLREYNYVAVVIDPAIAARLLDERDRRSEAAQTSIGSLLLGDPPPGYSALDRLNRSIDDAMQDQINRHGC